MRALVLWKYNNIIRYDEPEGDVRDRAAGGGVREEEPRW